jgi:hypothetical protein
MPMTDEEIEAAYQSTIDEYVGYEIDWNNPPGEAAIALESLIENHDPGEDNVLSESIDDLSQSFGSKKDFYESVMKPLHNIRQFKW